MSMFPPEGTSDRICGAAALPAPVADQSNLPSPLPEEL